MVLHLVYHIHICDQLGEALVFCACIYNILTNAYCNIILVL